MRIFAIALAAVVLAASGVFSSLPGEYVDDQSLRDIAGLQCAHIPSTAGQSNCTGGGICSQIPCGTGACGPNGVGFRCNNPGNPCTTCSGSSNQVCSAGNPLSKDLCYVVFTLCCATYKECKEKYWNNPSTGNTHFWCDCETGIYTTYDRQVAHISVGACGGS